MTTKNHLRFLILLGALLVPAVPPGNAADEPRQIMWKDLVPPLPADYVFPKLSKQQALQLSDIADVRERKARGEKVPPIELGDEVAAARKLEQAGVDVDGLLAKRKELAEAAASARARLTRCSTDKRCACPAICCRWNFPAKRSPNSCWCPTSGPAFTRRRRRRTRSST